MTRMTGMTRNMKTSSDTETANKVSEKLLFLSLLSWDVWRWNYIVNQYIFHCHVHIIPRGKGDLDKPKGGIRGVLSNKQND